MKSIEIFGKKYKIEYKDLMSEGNYGYVSHPLGIIVIDKSLKGEEKEHTLLHEFFHGVLDRIGVNQSLPNGVEEIIVESISKFLVENFRFDVD